MWLCISSEVGVMDVTIRRATEKDYPGMAILYDELNYLHSTGVPDVFLSPKTTPQDIQYVRHVLANEDCVLYVAQTEGKIIGLVEACIRESPPNIPVYVKRRYVYVENICVSPEYRRLSIGKRLMDSVEAWARQKKVYQIEFNVWAFNEPSLAFYAKLGYKPRQFILGKTLK
jgi:diamine N-acetyltransferase